MHSQAVPAGVETETPVTQPHQAETPAGRRARVTGTARRLGAQLLSRPTLLFIGCAAVSVAAWVIVAQWYSLFERHDAPKFSFGQLPGRFSATPVRVTTGLFVLLSVSYLIGYLALPRIRRLSYTALGVLVGLFLALLAVQTALYPIGALDVFNYIMWLKLEFHYNLNPYVDTLVQFEGEPLLPWVFFHRVTLFYGPAWLLLTGLPLLPLGYESVMASLVALKVLNAALLVATGLLIYRYRGGGKAGRLSAYLFVANPLILFEAIGNAHNDLLMTTFIVAAALALQRQSLLAGPLLMTAALVKVFAIVLAPVFIAAALYARWPPRRIAATMGWALALAVLLIAPFWADGQMYDNLRYSLERSQIYNSASPYALVREYLQDRDASEATIDWVRRAGLALFGLLTLAISWRVWRGRPAEPALADVMFLFMLLVSLLYPWYLIPLIALLALRPDRPALAYIFVGTTLGLLYHSLTMWAWFRGGFSAIQIHLIEAVALTLPILALLAAELVRAGLAYRRRAVAEQELSVA